jgi:hypothetical protein
VKPWAAATLTAESASRAYFQGLGTGSGPFAVKTVPCPCETTSAFKPIAPASTIMAKKRVVSLRDIRVPPGRQKPRLHSIRIYTNVKTKSYTPIRRPFDKLSPIERQVRWTSTALRIGFRTYRVNGTGVPNPLRTFSRGQFPITRRKTFQLSRGPAIRELNLATIC